jgi:uncharacterized LabA/DUF88 family protein
MRTALKLVLLMSPRTEEEEPMANKMMLFVDGENLVCRYQEMAKDGRTPQQRVRHQKDIYVWANGFAMPGRWEVIRGYYYTTVSGDDSKYQTVIDEIKGLSIEGGLSTPTITSANRMYPVVLKKNSRSAKAKGIDIQMTVDILTHVYQDNVDAVYLFSGDGDYKPIIDEAIRRGKRVFVAAFSNGFSPLLRQVADESFELDGFFFLSSTD